MNIHIPRDQERNIVRALRSNPVTAIIGASKCGKSYIAKHVCDTYENFLYLDLQDVDDLEKILGDRQAKRFLSDSMDKLIIIDEIQLRPELFPTLRVLADKIAHSRGERFKITHPARFLIIGSISPMLWRQEKESLTGRIAYERLTTLLITEIPDCDMKKYFIRGGFPQSYLANSDDTSIRWKKDYITNLLLNDLKNGGILILIYLMNFGTNL
ncbi:MAG: AAA family ATPase [Desulfovibrio sp.]|nr:AAA family ATPase [Desulfovibrio sp.]